MKNSFSIGETIALARERQSWLTYVCWGLLLLAFGSSLWSQNWNGLFLAVVVFALTLLPFAFSSWTDIRIPSGFLSAVVAFIVATIFFGEVGDFYERFSWWDTVLHTGSAIGFSLIGMLIVVFLLRGDRVGSSPILLGLMAFSFAAAIGGLWEIFEYAMDQIFGLNMQKDGLHDTMQDLIVDMIGALIGAVAGVTWITKGDNGILSGTINDFVESNPQVFDKA